MAFSRTLPVHWTEKEEEQKPTYPNVNTTKKLVFCCIHLSILVLVKCFVVDNNVIMCRGGGGGQ